MRARYQGHRIRPVSLTVSWEDSQNTTEFREKDKVGIFMRFGKSDHQWIYQYRAGSCQREKRSSCGFGMAHDLVEN